MLKAWWRGTGIGFVFVSLFGVALAVWTAEPAPKFVLSEVENLRLENLRLKKALLDSQCQAGYAALNRETEAFVNGTLNAHGKPAGVQFDPKSFSFTVQEPSQK